MADTSHATLAALEAKIGEQCDTVTWVTTGIFTMSIFLTILRPDPTLTICLFGFYGARRLLRDYDEHMHVADE